MMKLNKKGITIVELIISITLISVVMLFMYRLIADISYDKDSEYFASANQEQRVEIISAIETYIFENKITSISKNSDTKITIGDKEVIINGNEISFNSKSWALKDGYSFGNINCNTENSSIIECTIPVYTKNENNIQSNNNTIDDITFSIITKTL